MARLAESKVHLEVCPSCNVQIDVYPELASHPVEKLVRAGLSVGINTDARGVTALTLSEQYLRLNQTFGWTASDFAARNRDALAYAFIGDELRSKLMSQFSISYFQAG